MFIRKNRLDCQFIISKNGIIVDRLQQMKVFVAVAEEQGFAAGARRLRQSAPTVTRAVAGLEQHLGVKLLNRTTRYVRATQAGLRYLEDARRILADVDAAEDAAAGINAEPRGVLSVTAPVLFGRQFVVPCIVDYLQKYQNMQVNALFLDRTVGLLEEGLDVGVRIGDLPDSSLRALRVGAIRRVLVASPSYLNDHGRSETPQALALHTTIASSAGSFAAGWRFRSNGKEHSMRLHPRLTVTTNDAAIQAALEGLGITNVLFYQVADDIAAGRLEVVLAEHELPARPIHVIHREGAHSPNKVRAFIDLVATRLRAEESLNL